jgi:hypothetical protein
MTESHITDLHTVGILRIIGVFCIICGYQNKNGYNKYNAYPINHNSRRLQHDGVARNTFVCSGKPSHNRNILYNRRLSKPKTDTIISIPLTLSTTTAKASGMMESHIVNSIYCSITVNHRLTGPGKMVELCLLFVGKFQIQKFD